MYLKSYDTVVIISRKLFNNNNGSGLINNSKSQFTLDGRPSSGRMQYLLYYRTPKLRNPFFLAFPESRN